jgi:di/tricarboxylate transporter
VEIALIFIILGITVTLFVTEKFPVDLVAMMVLAMVVLTGLVTVEEGVSGFSNPATITVGAMFVLSAGLQKTGALQSLARLLSRFGRHPFILLLLLIPAAALPSAFINNTPVVAVFLPLVLAVCAKRKFSPSKFLIPLSFASQFGGVCTLIGTSTNILVSALSEKAGHGAFTMFEFSQLGLIMVGAGTAYFLVVGYWLLPERRGEELTATYQLGEYLTELRIMPASPLIGRTVLDVKFGERYDVTVVEILRNKEKLFSPLNEPMVAGDILLVRGQVNDLMELKSTLKLEMEPEFKLRDAALRGENVMLVETVVAPTSRLVGQTLKEFNFRRQYNSIVLALQRRGQNIREKLRDLRLRVGDALLVLGPKDEITRLRHADDLIVLEPVNEPSLRRHRAPLALSIVALVVLAASAPVFGGRALPILATAVMGCVALVVTRVISLADVYTAIDWKVIFLLAGILPLGIAMEKTGAAQFLAQQGIHWVGDFGPVAVLAVLYLVTAVLTECMSNNAAAVLLTPIAISTATALDVSPKPFLIAIMFAASTAFATPVGYQTNTMIYNPGGYRFADFMKVGIPLNLLFAGIAIYCIPRFWPF